MPGLKHSLLKRKDMTDLEMWKRENGFTYGDLVNRFGYSVTWLRMVFTAKRKASEDLREDIYEETGLDAHKIYDYETSIKDIRRV
jgi:cyanate lyase